MRESIDIDTFRTAGVERPMDDASPQRHNAISIVRALVMSARQLPRKPFPDSASHGDTVSRERWLDDLYTMRRIYQAGKIGATEAIES
jgi:hypothetical protein